MAAKKPTNLGKPRAIMKDNGMGGKVPVIPTSTDEVRKKAAVDKGPQAAVAAGLKLPKTQGKTSSIIPGDQKFDLMSDREFVAKTVKPEKVGKKPMAIEAQGQRASGTGGSRTKAYKKNAASRGIETSTDVTAPRKKAEGLKKSEQAGAKVTDRRNLEQKTFSEPDVQRGVGSVKKYNGAPATSTDSNKNRREAAQTMRERGSDPNKVVEVTTDEDTGRLNAKTALDKHQEAKREVDKFVLRGGRDNPMFTGSEATDPESRTSLWLPKSANNIPKGVRDLGTHVRNFISLSMKLNKTREDHQAMETARRGFHDLLASGVQAPQGMESICSTPGCSRTVEYGDKDGVPEAEQQRTPRFGDQCPGGTCNVRPSISPDSFNRPRG